ncbi:hypothetical protein BMS3Abin03_02145 [bacterium BMS3Abin03]|nr:hypothetical protein BMS3Abin03_02145 [bacterium BMS3Abin03]
MKTILIITTALLIIGCNSQKSKQENLSGKQENENSKLAKVFKPWNGTWEGKFYIYEDTLGQRKGEAQPKDISYEYLQSLPLKQNTFTFLLVHFFRKER